jgi:hypothetical protein
MLLSHTSFYTFEPLADKGKQGKAYQLHHAKQKPTKLNTTAVAAVVATKICY